MSPKKPIPGQVFALFEDEPRPDALPENLGYTPSDYDPPATSLEDYYGTLAAAVKAIGRSRSNKNGFPALSDSSEPAKEYAYRLSVEPKEAKHIVAKTDEKHRMKAQYTLNRQNQIEYDKIHRYAKATGAFTTEEVLKQMPLPPSIDELEAKYFNDSDKSPADLEKMRKKLYRRAELYRQSKPDKVA